jgi:catechol 2,3-dioxygenase-like lactoylglutathione lyase family enzyme
MTVQTVRVSSVGHTGITVSDIDASIAFYRDVLGFPVSTKVRVGGPVFEALTGVPDAQIDVAFVHAPDHVLELLCYTSPAQKTRSQLRPYDPGFMHVCLKVADIDTVVQAIAAAGFKAVGPIQTVPDGPAKGLRAIYTRDPDGVVLELIEEPPGIVLEQLFG